jgi:uncharacterized membrane protein YvbJ
MALIKCNECGTEISDSALACPKCGAKTKAQESRNSKKLVLFGIAVFVLFLIYQVNYGDSFKHTRALNKATEDLEDTLEKQNKILEKYKD